MQSYNRKPTRKLYNSFFIEGIPSTDTLYGINGIDVTKSVTIWDLGSGIRDVGILLDSLHEGTWCAPRFQRGGGGGAYVFTKDPSFGDLEFFKIVGLKISLKFQIYPVSNKYGTT